LREIRKTTINNYASIGRDSAEREGERERERTERGARARVYAILGVVE
jgi:hypothetical protein